MEGRGDSYENYKDDTLVCIIFPLHTKFGGIQSFGRAWCDGFHTIYRFHERDDRRLRGCEIVETKWNY